MKKGERKKCMMISIPRFNLMKLCLKNTLTGVPGFMAAHLGKKKGNKYCGWEVSILASPISWRNRLQLSRPATMQSIANLLSFLLKDSYRGTIQLVSIMPSGASMAMRRIRYPFLKNLTAKMQLVYRRSRGKSSTEDAEGQQNCRRSWTGVTAAA